MDQQQSVDSVQAAPPSEADVCFERSSTLSCHSRHHDSPSNTSHRLTAADTEASQEWLRADAMKDMVPNAEQIDGGEEVLTPVNGSLHFRSEKNTYSDHVEDISSLGCLEASHGQMVVKNEAALDSPHISSNGDHFIINNNNNNNGGQESPTHLISESVLLNNKKCVDGGFSSGISAVPDTSSTTSNSVMTSGQAPSCAVTAAFDGTPVSARDEGHPSDDPEHVMAEERSPSSPLSPLTTAEGGDAPCTSEDGLTINPFTHRIHFRYPYDYIKVAVLAVLLLPLRIVGICVSLVLAYIFSSLGLYGVPREELSQKPITGWRGYMRLGMGFSGRLMMRCYGFHVISIKGKLSKQKEAPILVVGPHSSFFDGVAVYWSKVPGIVSRRENLHIPLFGKYIDYTQPVYVWRESTNSRQETIQEIKHRATSKDNWPQVMVFPEGTCTNGTCLITFKCGAFYPGVPVQPIVVRYFNSMDTTTWTWDGPGALKLLFLTLCQFHNYCEIEYLPVYQPSEAEKNDAHLFAANVRAVMAKALGVPVVDYTYDDCRLMHRARVNKLPSQIGLIEFQKLRQQLGLNLKEVEQCLETQFCRLAHSDGKARLQDLARYLGLPASEPELVRLFNTYDRNSRGEINFREYLLGYCEVVKSFVTEQNIKSTFALFNADATGQVSLENFTKALASSFELNQQEAAAIFKEIDTQKNGSFGLDEWSSTSSRKGELLWLVRAYQQSVASASRHHTRPLQAASGKDKTE